ncbi:hypothetical protein [Hyunsoonleella pacifica]|uniref:Uncharacterized protein n=1 Tax=Hyunsoonleella pacifica TaxID=1080224 RepID=A0A4Q9FTW7_9FLAO|nr:hypothetical protein [Hyunsoonleella pacifica]TBN17589.1 hypothetical protein EYD46_04550 [Hyunsoonleella pacifica]GGD10646.1 hypothetical protein GCM10011368_10770 [Hyunsoonleella pacifica]
MLSFLFKKYKYSIILVLILVAVTATNAQEVRVIDNKGTLETIRNNQVTTASVAPTDPVEGDIWYDTSGTTRVTKTYDGTNWIANDSNVYNGVFIVSAAGITTVSAVPFQPTQVTFQAHANVENLDINADNAVGNNARGISNSYGTMNGFARLNTDNSITQQVIYVGGHGNSINDISRFASSSNCLGLRYGDQNGNNLGVISGALTSFTLDGFTINVTYTNGVITNNSTNPVLRVQPNDVQNEDLVVLFTAYR